MRVLLLCKRCSVCPYAGIWECRVKIALIKETKETRHDKTKEIRPEGQFPHLHTSNNP